LSRRWRSGLRVRISRYGFCNPQPLPKRGRGPGAEVGPRRTRHRAPRRRGGACARDPSWEPPEQLRRSDPGYHLLAGGRREFEGSIGFRAFRGWPARVAARLNFDAYITAIVVASAIVLAAPLIALAKLGLGPAQLILLAVLGAICAIDAGVALVNRG